MSAADLTLLLLAGILALGMATVASCIQPLRIRLPRPTSRRRLRRDLAAVRRQMADMQTDHGRCHAAHQATAERLVKVARERDAYAAWFARHSVVIGQRAVEDYRQGLTDVRESIEAWERGESS